MVVHEIFLIKSQFSAQITTKKISYRQSSQNYLQTSKKGVLFIKGVQCTFLLNLSFPKYISLLLYPDSGISMDEEIVLGDMMWSYNKAEL